MTQYIFTPLSGIYNGNMARIILLHMEIATECLVYILILFNHILDKLVILYFKLNCYVRGVLLSTITFILLYLIITFVENIIYKIIFFLKLLILFIVKHSIKMISFYYF